MTIQVECPCLVIEKWVTANGLNCQAHLQESDFRRYPHWRANLDRRQAKAEQARINFKLQRKGESEA
jgi:hypothetical protein